MPPSDGRDLERARALIADREYARAEQVLRRVLARAPRHDEALELLAHCQVSQGRDDEAFETRARALEGSPDDPEAHLARAWALRNVRGREDEAEAAIRAAIRLDPANARYRAELAWEMYRMLRYPESLTAAAEALELDPGNVLCNLAQAHSHYEMGQWPEAAGAAREALHKDPRNGPAHHVLGLVALRANDLAGARGSFQQAAAIDPNDRAARDGLREVWKRRLRFVRWLRVYNGVVHRLGCLGFWGLFALLLVGQQAVLAFAGPGAPLGALGWLIGAAPVAFFGAIWLARVAEEVAPRLGRSGLDAPVGKNKLADSTGILVSALIWGATLVMLLGVLGFIGQRVSAVLGVYFFVTVLGSHPPRTLGSPSAGTLVLLAAAPCNVALAVLAGVASPLPGLCCLAPACLGLAVIWIGAVNNLLGGLSPSVR